MAAVPELPVAAGDVGGGGTGVDRGVVGGAMDVDEDAGEVSGAAGAGGAEAEGRVLNLEETSGRGSVTVPLTGR